MPLRSWVGAEPVEVTQTIIPNVEAPYESTRINGVFNTIAWMGPPDNEIWDMVYAQLDVQTSAVVGDRTFMSYFQGSDGMMSRTSTIFAQASRAISLILQPGLPWSSNSWGVGEVGSSSYTGPLYVSVLANPCRIGFLWETFQDAADVVYMRAFYQRRVRL